MMRIGELAKRSDVGVETVRFYEQKGLIEQPGRPLAGGYRDYPMQFVGRIKFIRSAQNIGFSLLEISELFELEAAKGARCVEVRQRAQSKQAQVRNKISALQRIDQALEQLINSCPGEGSVTNCSILEAIKGDDHNSV